MNFLGMLKDKHPPVLWAILRQTITGHPNNHTITQAARLLSIGRPALSNVLGGKAAVSLGLAFQIERVYNIPAEPMLSYQTVLQYREWLNDRVDRGTGR